MITLISPAKTMRAEVPAHQISGTKPIFEKQATALADELKSWSANDWINELNLSPQLASDVAAMYQDFTSAERHPAVLGYDGVVSKYMHPTELSETQLSTLRICSFLYGLLRPTDEIASYRLEGHLKLKATQDKSLFAFWKARLTDLLISDLEADPDHTLLFLGSEEMKKLFDWKRITRTFTVLQPLFLQHYKNKLRQIVVHTKMYRGTMAHTALRDGWHGTVEELIDFARQEEMEFTEGDKPGVYHLIMS